MVYTVSFRANFHRERPGRRYKACIPKSVHTLMPIQESWFCDSMSISGELDGRECNYEFGPRSISKSGQARFISIYKSECDKYPDVDFTRLENAVVTLNMVG